MSTTQNTSTQAVHISIGGYFGNPNGSDPAAEQAFEIQATSFAQLMGAPAAFLTYYVDERQPVADWPGNAGWQAWSAAQSPDARGATPVIGLPMTSTASSASPDLQYQAFASGQYDGAIRGVVRAWADHGFTTQYWRPGWEMNVQSMPSYGGDDGQTQADWVAAFRHVAGVLRQAAAGDGVDLKVIWNPNVTNWDTAGTLAHLYPGNDVVDVIGADIYANMFPYNPLYDWHKNDGTVDSSLAQWMADPVNRAHYWAYPAATPWSLDGSGGHDLSLQTLLDFAKAQGKPFAIPEAGAGNSDGGHDVADDAAFPAWLAQTLAASGVKTEFVNLWDANADGNYDFSSASADKPGEAAAWAKYFGTPAATAAAQAALATAAPEPTAAVVGSGADTIALAVSEDAWQGDAQFTVAVDGRQVGGVLTASASHALGQEDVFAVQGDFGAGRHAVAMTFLNDAWGGSADTDRNLYVTGAQYDGTAVAGAGLALLSNGSQNFSFGAASPSAAAPAAPAPIALGSGPDALTLRIAEDAWNGDAQFTVCIDGRQVGGVLTASASHAAGQEQAVTVNTTLAAGAHQVSVSFLNDAWGGSADTDRNLYVTGASLDGKDASGAAAALYGDGSSGFAVEAPGATAPVTSTLVLGVSEDAWMGDAQFTVVVDGHQAGGTYTAAASHAAGQSQDVTLSGLPEDFMAHDVAVSFVNDAWGGTPSTDRNLYVDSAKFDGSSVAGASAALFGNGTVHLSAVAPANWTG